MKSRHIVIAGLLFILSSLSVSEASKLPARTVTPTGCASGGFDVAINATREWGVVPFTSIFTVSTSGGTDSVEAVYWTFGIDDPIQAVGATAAPTSPP